MRAPGPEGLPRLLAGIDPSGATMTLTEHERVHGPMPQITTAELIEEVELSGLRGRGGADFPTARKLRSLAGRRRGGGVLLVNGSETEPASEKDYVLLSQLPHLVLDGAILAAEAVGAGEIIVKVGERSLASLRALQSAVSVRPEEISIGIATGPDGYVTGEETAVINHLNGGRAVPTFVPPRPFERGYRGRPTLVQNPETLAQLGMIARFGASWFRELGTDADPGSVLVTIGGAVAAPGVYEMAFGTPLSNLLSAAGGTIEPLRAVLIGGYFGTWMDARDAERLCLARTDLRSVGCSLGSGVLIALGESSCGLHETARLVDYLAGESAGQCGPCVYGLRAIADAVIALADGIAHESERERVLRWTSEIRGRGACHHPDGAARLVESALAVFAGEIENHRHVRCAARPAGLPLAHAFAEAA